MISHNVLNELFKIFRRYLSNSTVFNELVDTALSKNARYAIGGNAPIMAMRFAEAGFSVLLAAKITPLLEKDLPNNISGKFHVLLLEGAQAHCVLL